MSDRITGTNQFGETVSVSVEGKTFTLQMVTGYIPTKKELPPLPSREKRRKQLQKLTFTPYQRVEEQLKRLLDEQELNHALRAESCAQVRTKMTLSTGEVYYFQAGRGDLIKCLK